MSVIVDSDHPLEEVRAVLFEGVVAELQAAGYRLRELPANRFELSRSYRSASVWGLSALAGPLGLVLLALLRRSAVLHLHLAAAPTGGTYVTVSGETDPGWAARLRRLSL